jgi:hypothetical protein
MDNHNCNTFLNSVWCWPRSIALSVLRGMVLWDRSSPLRTATPMTIANFVRYPHRSAPDNMPG